MRILDFLSNWRAISRQRRVVWIITMILILTMLAANYFLANYNAQDTYFHHLGS